MMYREEKSLMKRSWVEVRNLEGKSLMKRSWVEVRNLEMSLIQKNLVQKSL
jgi:hypothetical protein